MAAGATIFAVQSSSATDFTLDASSSAQSLSANDTVTIDSFYGADNNSDADLINVDVDDISITINGTLQGGNDLIMGGDQIDNLAITIAEGGEVVANNTRAFDIDGVSRIQDNVTITNSGTIYAKNRNAISAQTIRDSTITNNATGLISAADRTILLVNATRTTLTNNGSIVANEDNISYRNDTLSMTRTTSTPGYAIAATSATDLTLVNAVPSHQMANARSIQRPQMA